MKASDAELARIRKEEETAAVATLELEAKLNDEASLYGKFLDAAAKIWQSQIQPSIAESTKLQQAFNKQMEDLGKLTPIPLFKAEPQGRTLARHNEGCPGRRSTRRFPKWWRPTRRHRGYRRDMAPSGIDHRHRLEQGDRRNTHEHGRLRRKNLKSLFKQTAESILRFLIEQLFKPMMNWLCKILNGLFSVSQAGSGAAATAGGGGGGFGAMFAGMGMSAGGAAATGGLMASIMALQSKNTYAKGAGAVGLYGTGTALAMSAVTGMPLMSAMSAAFLNPFTAALAGAVIGGIAIYKHIKDPLNLAGKEAGRDLGITMSKSTMESFTAGLGFTSKDQWKGIRKDLEMSPLFIQQIALPAAQAAGTVDLLSQKLSKVETSWGTFDFSAAFDLGSTTGDWSAFNAQYEQAFQTSEALNAALPDWKTKLEIPASIAEGWTMTAAAMKLAWDTYYDSALKAASVGDEFNAFLIANRQHLQELVAIYPQQAGQMKQIDFLALYTQFEKTGRITEQFGDAIVAAGGDIKKFQVLANIAKINADFREMVDVFNQTGEIRRACGTCSFSSAVISRLWMTRQSCPT